MTSFQGPYNLTISLQVKGPQNLLSLASSHVVLGPTPKGMAFSGRCPRHCVVYLLSPDGHCAASSENCPAGTKPKKKLVVPLYLSKEDRFCHLVTAFTGKHNTPFALQCCDHEERAQKSGKDWHELRASLQVSRGRAEGQKGCRTTRKVPDESSLQVQGKHIMALNSEQLYTHKLRGPMCVCNQKQRECGMHHRSVGQHSRALHFQDPEFDFYHASFTKTMDCCPFIS